jgi:hypothetical protein
MQSRLFGLGAALFASTAANGYFAVKLDKTTKQLQHHQKECELKVQAVRNEPTHVSLFLDSAANANDSAPKHLGTFQGRGREVNVTLNREMSTQGTTVETFGVTFGKK